MEKKGFIATSLIYSFFLAFISIVAVLLQSFIANKTILDRFNSKVQEELNTSSYKVTIYSRNANIKNGMTMTNLISNGDFSQNLDFWNVFGDAQYSTTLWLDNYSVLKSNNNVSNSYLYQNLYVMKDNIYYLSSDYLHDNDTNLYAYLGDKDEYSLNIRNNLSQRWTKSSANYKAVFDGNTQLILGDGGVFSYVGNSYFTNVMVLNLTASFGLGYEPDILWVDDNISWFNGTISYLQLGEIEYGASVTVDFTPYKGYDNYTISCVDDDGRSLSNYSISNLDTEFLKLDGTESDDESSNGEEDGSLSTDERKSRMMEIREITGNIKCNVDWRT